MLPYRDSRITRVLIGVFFLVVIGYAAFELRGIVQGPVIMVTSASTKTDEPLIMITGTASRISSLSMNGEAVSVTERGDFTEPYLLAPGLNLIVLEARDKYGRRTRHVTRVVYAAPAVLPVSTTTATSTATTTVAN